MLRVIESQRKERPAPLFAAQVPLVLALERAAVEVSGEIAEKGLQLRRRHDQSRVGIDLPLRLRKDAMEGDNREYLAATTPRHRKPRRKEQAGGAIANGVLGVEAQALVHA